MATECPRIGTKLQIDFEVSDEMSPLKPFLLEAQGQVVRIGPRIDGSGNRGFAVQLRRTRVQTR